MGQAGVRGSKDRLNSTGVCIKCFWGLSMLVNIMGAVESDHFEINLQMNKSLNILPNEKLRIFVRNHVISKLPKCHLDFHFEFLKSSLKLII